MFWEIKRDYDSASLKNGFVLEFCQLRQYNHLSTGKIIQSFYKKRS